MVDVSVDMPDFTKIANTCTKKAKIALFKVASNYYTHLKQDGFMPFDTGTLQNTDTYMSNKGDSFEVISKNAYARRLYYHPEYHFQKVNNEKAGAYWFEKELEFLGGEEELAKEFIRNLEV